MGDTTISFMRGLGTTDLPGRFGKIMDSKIIFWAEWRAAARVVYMGGASSRMPYFSAAQRRYRIPR